MKERATRVGDEVSNDLERMAKRICSVLHPRPGFESEACAKGYLIADEILKLLGHEVLEIWHKCPHSPPHELHEFVSIERAKKVERALLDRISELKQFDVLGRLLDWCNSNEFRGVYTDCQSTKPCDACQTRVNKAREVRDIIQRYRRIRTDRARECPYNGTPVDDKKPCAICGVSWQINAGPDGSFYQHFWWDEDLGAYRG